MKKSILNIGKALNKAEQKLVYGGRMAQIEGLHCSCNGTTYAVGDCKWCGWMCGAGTVQGCS